MTPPTDAAENQKCIVGVVGGPGGIDAEDMHPWRPRKMQQGEVDKPQRIANADLPTALSLA